MLISREELSLRFSRTCYSGPIENSIDGLQGRLEKTEVLDQNLLSEALNLILQNSFNEREVLITHIHNNYPPNIDLFLLLIPQQEVEQAYCIVNAKQR